MLCRLRIDNFALIDQAEINFNRGFTVITGETGSGKSILLNALNLILGERANFNVIGKLKEKSIVEGEIDLTGFDVKDFFEANELDYDDRTILRREIYRQGRSRAFVNDVPVQLSVLKDLSSKLVHIHSQYNTLELKEPAYQLDVLDILAGTGKLRSDFSTRFMSFLDAKKRLARHEEELLELRSVADYNQFQLNELEQADLDNTDYEGLRQQMELIGNAEELLAIFTSLPEAIGGDGGIIDSLNEIRAMLNNFKGENALVKEFRERMDSMIVESRDISDTALRQLDRIERDPERLKELQLRLDEFNRLLYKHRMSTREELIAYRDKLAADSANTASIEHAISELRELTQSEEQQLWELAEDLHAKRLKAVEDIERTIAEELAHLKLKGTRLIFKLDRTTGLSSHGITGLEMYFSPNEGIEPVPVHQAASGGELSRLMLTLQHLISEKMKLQTILFDEIDTGVSGDVAQKIGATLKKMGENMQVIAITHLPQVAAKGAYHLRVDKFLVDGQTKTSVAIIEGDERISEIARLMSGDRISQAAIENAKTLISS